MPTIFLSHAGEDAERARRLADLLRGRRIDVWLDLEKLQPGDRWMEALETAFAASTAFLVYVGRSGVQRWVDREVRLALVRNTGNPDYRIVPVLAAGVDPSSLPPFLAQHQAVVLTEDDRDEAWVQRLSQLLGEPARPAAALAADEPPFRGLLDFRPEHAHLFFGRDREVDELLDRLRRGRLLAVVGASGSGKSSLVHAGLVPALHRGRFHESGAWATRWQIASFRPADDPFRELAAALAELDPHLSAEGRIRVIAQMKDALASGTEGIATCVAGLVPQQVRTLLVVDQFEELFTLTADASVRARCIDSLLRAVQGAGDRPIYVALTLRADFYSRCWEHPTLPRQVADHQYAVQRMSEAQLREVIARPLAMAGLEPDPGLIETLLAEVGHEPGNLPLLEHALEQLWLRRAGNRLTNEAYQAIGRLRGALRNHADGVYARLQPTEQEIARRIFLDLTQLGEGAEDTRRRARRRDIVGVAAENDARARVLLALVDENLITSDRDPASGDDVVEVSHEALIREWPVLRGWLDASRDALRIETIADIKCSVGVQQMYSET